MTNPRIRKIADSRYGIGSFSEEGGAPVIREIKPIAEIQND